jgi:hypothetical protein
LLDSLLQETFAEVGKPVCGYSAEMGAFLDKPKTEKYNESRVGGGLRYGLSSMQGWRIEMEDAHSAVIGIPDQKENVSWFAGSRLYLYHRFHSLSFLV